MRGAHTYIYDLDQKPLYIQATKHTNIMFEGANLVNMSCIIGYIIIIAYPASINLFSREILWYSRDKQIYLSTVKYYAVTLIVIEVSDTLATVICPMSTNTQARAYMYRI